MGSAYFKDQHDKNFNISSMTKYVGERQQMDLALEKMMAPYLAATPKVLDACCGIGHLMYFLSDIAPNAQFTGVDETEYLLEEGRKLCAAKNNITFIKDNVLNLPLKMPKTFDLTISWKTLSWLPYYEEMTRALVAVTKKHIFLNSLFYDGDIDFEIKVREHKKEAGKYGPNAYYNIYSYERFKNFVASLGAKNVEAHDFELSVDVPRGDANLMGTYTKKLADGTRMQLSGAVQMLWKIIRIDL